MTVNLEEIQRKLNDGNQVELPWIVHSLVEHTGASGAIVWDCSQTPFKILAEHYSGADIDLWCTQKQHQKLLRQVAQNGRPAVVTNDKNGKPTDDAPILVAPIPNGSTNGSNGRENGSPSRLVELVFSSKQDVVEPSRQLSLLCGLCDLVAKQEAKGERSQAVGTEPQPSQTRSASRTLEGEKFAQFSLAIHRSLDKAETFLNVANEALLASDCDRVSVVLRTSKGFQIQSISGQPSVNRRSSTVQTLEKLAQRVLETGAEFWFPNSANLSPQVQSALDGYLEHSSARSVAVLPIERLESSNQQDPDGDRSKEGEVIAGLLFEQFRCQWDREERSPLLHLINLHCASAIRNSLEHRDLFLYPVWRALGKSKALVSAKRLPKTVAVSVGVAVVTLFMTLWPASYYVSAEGQFLPENRRLIFPLVEGEVERVAVQQGQVVAKGETLVVLASEDLRLRIEDTKGQLETLSERKATIQRRKFRADPKEKAAKEESLRAIQSEMDSLELQLAELRTMESHLTIKSPISGQVITWDIEQNLEGRVVNPQNQLLEVANTDGQWHLQLEVPAKFSDEVMRGWRNAKRKNAKPLLVSFSLASEPGRTYEGEVKDVGEVIQLNQEREPVLPVKVSLDSSAIELKKARSGVQAKIYTGTSTSLAGLWLSEVPDAFRRYIGFYFVR